jgi:hypothetical protein
VSFLSEVISVEALESDVIVADCTGVTICSRKNATKCRTHGDYVEIKKFAELGAEGLRGVGVWSTTLLYIVEIGHRSGFVT